MNPTEAIATISLGAAHADGSLSPEETARLQELLEPEAAASLIAAAQSGSLDIGGAAGALPQGEDRKRAYELAVCVVEADGHRTDAEAAFLHTLATHLGIDPATEQGVLAQADALAVAPAEAPAPAAPSDVDALVRNTAIVAGALELLPQTLAGFAVIPLQTNLVYRIGKRHRITLDGGHVKEFLAVGGIGMTSQLVEGFARKFLGGFAKKFGGGLASKITTGATGPILTFATTYALGKLADQYYGGGRKLSAFQLKETFSKLVGDAQRIGDEVKPEIEARAKTLNLSELPAILTGKA